MKDFLLELHTEELPPKLLPKMITHLAQNFTTQLGDLELSFDEIEQFATPRRMAILVRNLSEEQQDKIINKKGPSIKAPEQAVNGFAKSNSVSIDDLSIENDYYYFKGEQQGAQTKNLLADICKTAIENIPLTRPMRWGDNEFSFIRPVHSIIMLFGEEIIATEFMNLQSGNTTTGLRFRENTIVIDSAQNYQKIMLANDIEPNFATRRNNIKQQIAELEKKHGVQIIENNALLEEVCALVEYPKAFMGKFEEKFLDLPQEVIVNSLAEHQKYFSITQNAKLSNTFIAIANLESKDIDVVIKGNEKVVTPRLEDGQFFWDTDKKTTLESKLEKLKTVLFMQDLGSMFEKTQRIEQLAGEFASQIGADAQLASRAAKLAKADLVSGMVGEFASLQGVMGGYYARFDGENELVAEAITQHYNPKFAGDDLPSSEIGVCVAIADKMDTICGIFGINQAPTGSKDPYALRRLALGLMRIFIEKELTIDLKALVSQSLTLHFDSVDETILQQILDFMSERLRGYYKDLGIKTTSFLSAITVSNNNPYDTHLRIVAIDEFSKTSEGKDLIEINKRINNILKDADYKENHTLTHPIELALNEKISSIKSDNYQVLMQSLLSLKPELDDFFDNLIVNDADENIKNARFTLLKKVATIFASIGDLTI